jgi:hypothetical protein
MTDPNPTTFGLLAGSKVSADELAEELARRARTFIDWFFSEYRYTPDVADFKEEFLLILERRLQNDDRH